MLIHKKVLFLKINHFKTFLALDVFSYGVTCMPYYCILKKRVEIRKHHENHKEH